MDDFELDPRLQNDCSLLMQEQDISYLLHHNAVVIWLIRVPHSRETEFYRLPDDLQQRILRQINRLSDCLLADFDSDKLNLAMIGNVVSQLHVHIIGRRRDDAYWPDVVWGKAFAKTHDRASIADIRARLHRCLGDSG